MHETPQDLVHLQALLDGSYTAAGKHLRSIMTPERRLTAKQLAGRLQGMCLLVLATAIADGIFYRGRFYLGSSPDSLRFRHIRQRSAVGATHLPGEALAITVHGHAAPIEVASSAEAGFRRALLDVYVPLYGPSWEHFLDDGAVYARLDAERMYTFHMSRDS